MSPQASAKNPLPLVVGLDGTWPTTQEDLWLAQWQPVGVILFARNVTDLDQLTALCTHLHALVPGTEIMSDHEGGPVSQLAGAVGRPPAAWTLGTLDDPRLTYDVHRETARRLLGVGVDRILAPCADVLTEPNNPVIGARAFGSNTRQVTTHVTQAVKGLLDGGLRVCLKHWPGHGDSFSDSHEEPALGQHRPEPFWAGQAAGADAIMVGHLSLDGSVPATLDSGALKGLRNQLEPPYLLADDVTMGALRPALAALGVKVDDGRTQGLIAPEDLPLAWFEALWQAGCDWLLIRGIPWTAYPLDEKSPTLTLTGTVLSAEPAKKIEITSLSCYAQARGKAGPPLDFFDPCEPLLWLDLAEHDRWLDVRTTGDLDRILSAGFADVRRFDDPSRLLAENQVAKRLLVTCHRPMPDWVINSPVWTALANGSGQALVMGHPVLASQLQALIGQCWSIAALYDICGLDLDPGEF